MLEVVLKNFAYQLTKTDYKCKLCLWITNVNEGGEE